MAVHLENAKEIIEKVAQVLGEKYDIKVYFEGNRCETDGRTIWLPNFPDKMPNEFIEMLRGHLDHEVGHIIFSDFRTIRKSKSQLEAFALNAIEDIRIEREMEKIWKGCKINFQRNLEMILESMKTAWTKHKDEPLMREDPVSKILALIIIIARAPEEIGERFLEEAAPEYIPVIDFLSDEIEATKELKSTRDAKKLSKKVLDKIAEFKEEIERAKAEKRKKEEAGAKEKTEVVVIIGKSKPEGSKESDSEPEPEELEIKGVELAEPEDAESEAEEESKESEPEPKEPELEEPEEPGSEEPPEEPEPPKETKEPEIEITAELSELADEIGESLEDTSKERKSPVDFSVKIIEAAKASSTSEYRPYTSKIDTFDYPSERGRIERYNELLRDLDSTGTVSTLKNQLVRILLSQKRNRWLGGKRQGIINPAALHHIVNGTSDQVFRKRHTGTAINTAVSILIDLSGSMGYSKTDMAKKTTILLAEALKSIAPFEILGFTGDLHHTPRSFRDLPREERACFSRWGSLDMIKFKTFDEPFDLPQKERIAGMSSQLQNYDGESVLFAAKRLLQQPEQKKVLFVLSDGAPCAAACRSNALEPHLHKVVAELSAIPNFHLVGFGILTDAPQKFYPNHVLVNDLAKLPDTLITSLYSKLVANK